MKRNREEIVPIVREFHERLKEIYGPRLKGVYLYGSYARDEADDDSDIDVAVVLDGPVRFQDEIERISEMRAALCLRNNCIVMPFFLTEEEFEKTPYAIHRSIRRECMPV